MTKKLRWAIPMAIMLIVMGLLPLAGCGGDGEGPNGTATPAGELTGTINAAGSTSVQPLLQRMASEFTGLHPQVKINVGGGGSSHGIKVSCEGSAELGAASREIKMTECDLIPWAIARDAVAVVVHPDNPVAGLTVEAVKQIYAGEITNWSEVGGPDSSIQVVSREEGSGTRDCFESKVMGPLGARIMGGAIFLDSNGAVRSKVSTTQNAIGYLSLGYVEGVKAVSLDNVEPTLENCLSGEYPVVRRLYLLTKDEPSNEIAAFISFCRSREGQDIAAEEGYVPLNLNVSSYQGLLADGEIRGTIDQAGSTSVQPLAQRMASEFTAQNPQVRINIGGGGSSHGIKVCCEGSVELGAASRDVRMSECDVVPHAIARDAVAVVVHPDNPVSELTMAQVKDIYAGLVTNWSQVGGPNSSIQVVSREEGSGTRDCFETAAMQPFNAKITGSAVFLDSNGAVRSKVSTTQNAIGYLSLGYVEGLNTVAVDGVEPTVESCTSGEYPIVRKLYVLTTDVPAGAVKAFLDFCRSDEGQALALEEGYIPLKK